MDHICKFIEDYQKSEASKVEVIFDEDIWMLKQSAFAIDQDVRVGEADYIGELLSSSAVKISFCPFCGKRLQLLS
ncbi:MAG: hypothetical protein KGO49_08875 [Gammaproteobacteria bacterium]|jgi:hypothetical protein|nr:hypothetical protein [Gammaproteobacteria bacterium]